MADDPVTLGELGRRMETGFANLKEDIHDLATRLDKKVSEDIYEYRHAGLSKRVESLENAREQDAKQRVSDRRWRIASVAIPVAGIFIAAIVAIVIAAMG